MDDQAIHRIRPAEPEEFGALTAIWKAAVEATHDFVTPEEIAGWEPRIAAEFLPAVEVWVAADDADRPVGFIGLAGDSLEMLFVAPSMHGQGIGRLLVERASSGKNVLKVDVNEENGGAVAFYERLGFRPVGRSDLDSDGRPHPLVHLVRKR